MAGDFKDVGFVVKTQDYKDADKIITLVTRNHGLITVFAIGARRQNSKKSPHLDLISLVEIQVSGKEYLFMDQASTTSSFPKIKSDLKKISLCMSFFEVLTQMVPSSVDDPELFKSLVVFITRLEEIKEEKELNQISSKFARYLLRHLGYSDIPPQSLKSMSGYFESLMNRKIIAKEMV